MSFSSTVYLASTNLLALDSLVYLQVKITSSNEEMLRAAVEQFIDKEPQQIEDVAMSTLEGHQVNKYIVIFWISEVICFSGGTDPRRRIVYDISLQSNPLYSEELWVL